MNIYLAEFILVAGLHLLAMISPGPDFVMVSRSSLVYSRKAGIFSALGLALGVLVHITYSLVGLAYIISKSIVLFSTLKYLGALYLLYIGYKSLRAKSNTTKETSEKAIKELTPLAAMKTGFLTNAFNPKVTLFFLALFTQVIHQNTPLLIKLLYGLEMSLATFIWFTLVSLLLSHSKVKSRFNKIQHYIEKTTGAILIALGIKVALSRQ